MPLSGKILFFFARRSSLHTKCKIGVPQKIFLKNNLMFAFLLIFLSTYIYLETQNSYGSCYNETKTARLRTLLFVSNDGVNVKVNGKEVPVGKDKELKFWRPREFSWAVTADKFANDSNTIKKEKTSSFLGDIVVADRVFKYNGVDCEILNKEKYDELNGKMQGYFWGAIFLGVFINIVLFMLLFLGYYLYRRSSVGYTKKLTENK